MVFAQLMSIFTTVKSISSVLSDVGGVQATTLGATGVSGVALIIAIYYGRSMYDNMMHRLDRLEDRISKDINDRHDDLNTKVDSYHETDVRTYERMLITGPPSHTVSSSRGAKADETDEESESEESSRSKDDTGNDIKEIHSDVRYIKRKVRHLRKKH
jgi:hypothetical protein